MNRKWMIPAVLGLFVAGAPLSAGEKGGRGADGGKGWQGKMGGKHFGKRMAKHARNRLSEKLDLNADQEKKVGEILEAKAAKAKAILLEAREKGDALREEGAKEIRALLTKEQAEKFDRHQARKERRRAERRARFSGKDKSSKD